MAKLFPLIAAGGAGAYGMQQLQTSAPATVWGMLPSWTQGGMAPGAPQSSQDVGGILDENIAAPCYLRHYACTSAALDRLLS